MSVYLPDPVNIESDENKNLRRYAALLRINLRILWAAKTMVSLPVFMINKLDYQAQVSMTFKNHPAVA